MHLSAIPTLFALIPSFGTAVSALPLTKSNHEPHNPPVRELYIWQQREQSTYPKTRRYIIHCPSPDAVVAVGNVPFNTSNLLPLDKRDAKNVSPNVCGTGPPGGCRMYFKRDDPYWQEDHWDILNSWKSPWDNTKRFAPLAASLEPVPKPPSTEDRAFCNGMAHAFKAAGYTSSGTARLDDAACIELSQALGQRGEGLFQDGTWPAPWTRSPPPPPQSRARTRRASATKPPTQRFLTCAALRAEDGLA